MRLRPTHIKICNQQFRLIDSEDQCDFKWSRKIKLHIVELIRLKRASLEHFLHDESSSSFSIVRFSKIPLAFMVFETECPCSQFPLFFFLILIVLIPLNCIISNVEFSCLAMRCYSITHWLFYPNNENASLQSLFGRYLCVLLIFCGSTFFVNLSLSLTMLRIKTLRTQLEWLQQGEALTSVYWLGFHSNFYGHLHNRNESV